MIKNNKGFSLMELTIVVLILTVLLSIGIPQYRASTRKTQIASQLPIMRSLQNDMINFYNLYGNLPTSLFQLSLNRGDFGDPEGDVTTATHNTNNCTFSLLEGGSTVEVDCGQGWNISYTVIANSNTIRPGSRTFNITEDEDLYIKIAENLGWEQVDDTNSFNII